MKPDFLEIALIFLALVIVLVLFYFINRKQIARDELMRKKLKELQEQEFNFDLQESPIAPKRKATPQILTAYERMTILLERIDPNKIAARVAPISLSKQDYANFLVQHIEQEYEFNISQQLYVSEEAWALILTAKNASIQHILKTALKEEVNDANDLQKQLLLFVDDQSITTIAKNRLRKEVAEFL